MRTLSHLQISSHSFLQFFSFIFDSFNVCSFSYSNSVKNSKLQMFNLELILIIKSFMTFLAVLGWVWLGYGRLAYISTFKTCDVLDEYYCKFQNHEYFCKRNIRRVHTLDSFLAIYTPLLNFTGTPCNKQVQTLRFPRSSPKSYTFLFISYFHLLLSQLNQGLFMQINYHLSLKHFVDQGSNKYLLLQFPAILQIESKFMAEYLLKYIYNSSNCNLVI